MTAQTGSGSAWIRQTLRPQEVLWSPSFLAPPEDLGELAPFPGLFCDCVCLKMILLVF